MGRTGFKVLSSSPWPICVSFGVMGVIFSFISAVHGSLSTLSLVCSLVSWVALLSSLINWWAGMINESTQDGNFTSRMKRSLQWGFNMFVVSEVFFFSSFFSSWYYFGVGENSQVLMGSWPPVGIAPVYPWKIPTLNTVLLLSSGVCVSWCQSCVVGLGMIEDLDISKMYREFRWSKHPAVAEKWEQSHMGDEVNKHKLFLRFRMGALVSMLLSIILGSVFFYLQSLEYRWASVTFSDSTYGGCFYILTGFHGVHVILGVCGLLACLVRIYFNHFSFKRSHVGFSCAVLYWHFVDVVWIGVYVSVYLWPYFL